MIHSSKTCSRSHDVTRFSLSFLCPETTASAGAGKKSSSRKKREHKSSSSSASSSRSRRKRWSKSAQTHSYSKIYSYVFERCRNCDTYIYLSGFRCEKVSICDLPPLSPPPLPFPASAGVSKSGDAKMRISHGVQCAGNKLSGGESSACQYVCAPLSLAIHAVLRVQFIPQ